MNRTTTDTPSGFDATRPFCCSLGCSMPAEFSISTAPHRDSDQTQACEDHVGALLSDGENVVTVIINPDPPPPSRLVELDAVLETLAALGTDYISKPVTVARIKALPVCAANALPFGVIDPDYARVFTIARCIAWSYGYALMMHGSFTRDLDLLAVPWTNEASADPRQLVNLLAQDCDLNIQKADPSEKAHGRLVWTLTFKAFGDPRFIDFGVMPAAISSHQTEARDV